MIPCAVFEERKRPDENTPNGWRAKACVGGDQSQALCRLCVWPAEPFPKVWVGMSLPVCLQHSAGTNFDFINYRTGI